MIVSADRIITGDGATVLHDAALFVDKEGCIGKIGEAATLRSLYPDEEVAAYPGATLLPGLVDMHVHIGCWWTKPDTDNYNDFLIACLALSGARQALEAGVTTLRDVSSPEGLCRTLNLAARKGYAQIPRIVGSDRGICMTGGHGDEAKGGVQTADGPWAVRAAIREQIKKGAQWIKILTSHRSDTPEYTQEELDAAVDEAHRVGRKIAVHAGSQPSIGMCVDAGFDTIEHGTFLTVEQARRMAEKGIVWVPTILAYTDVWNNFPDDAPTDETAAQERAYFKAAAEAYRENFGKLIGTGVKVAAGSDMIMDENPCGRLSEELQLMVDYGMEPIKAIQAATSNGAETLGLSHRTGSIREGLAADLLLAHGDPLADMANIANVRAVYLQGSLV